MPQIDPERMIDRDPRIDPKPGDVVLACGKNDHSGAEVRYYPLTVQARIGSLVAFTEDGHPDKVVWLLVKNWCEVFDPITEWKVIHAAD